MGAPSLFGHGTTAPLESPVTEFGATARSVAEAFDYDLTKPPRHFTPYDLRPLIQAKFNIGVVVGSSGSGKTQALRTIGDPSPAVTWDPNRCVADHFPDGETAMRLLGAAGLNSVPQWLKPHHLLSNGEQYRADLARLLGTPQALLVIDEFTSVVDRTVARSLCEALCRFARTRGDIVVASCHFDVVDWLQPDWVVNTNCNQVAHHYQAPTQPWRMHVFEEVAELTRG